MRVFENKSIWGSDEQKWMEFFTKCAKSPLLQVWDG